MSPVPAGGVALLCLAHSGRDTVDLAVMFVLVALVFWKHRANFARLTAGKELGVRASFFQKKYRVEENQQKGSL